MKINLRWWAKQVIGDKDCPIMHRWELIKFFGRKAMVHHFLPGADDRDFHDHPRGFLLICFYGSYLDLGPHQRPPDIIHAGSVRYRPPQHMHKTLVGIRGCWTLVFTTKELRKWGFLRGKTWWPFKDYLATFGEKNMRCP